MHACVGGGDQVYSMSCPPSVFLLNLLLEGGASGCAEDAGLPQTVGKICWVSDIGVLHIQRSPMHAMHACGGGGTRCTAKVPAQAAMLGCSIQQGEALVGLRGRKRSFKRCEGCWCGSYGRGMLLSDL